MNWLDIVIIALMVFLIVRGIFRGFVREIGSLAGVVAGIILANIYQPALTSILKGYLGASSYISLVSFALIFLVVLVAFNLAGYGLKLILQKALLGWADRSLGLGLAVVKGIVITYFGIVLLTYFVSERNPHIANSRLVPLIVSSYQYITNIVSPSFYETWKKKLLP
ncbi:MAG: CvpA family protein [Desulfobacteraceae bacterium]|jgi:membrane protein required for colicin V production|nr:MAG: CvpA family protein [Desulfobacteraceae bacterium]